MNSGCISAAQQQLPIPPNSLDCEIDSLICISSLQWRQAVDTIKFTNSEEWMAVQEADGMCSVQTEATTKCGLQGR